MRQSYDTWWRKLLTLPGKANRSASSRWNEWSTLLILVVVGPILYGSPHILETLGLSPLLGQAPGYVALLGMTLCQITFFGVTLSRGDYEVVTMGTLIHRPIELLVVWWLWSLGQLDVLFAIAASIAVPGPALLCYFLWRRETKVSGTREFWLRIVTPAPKRSAAGRFNEYVGWLWLGIGALTLFAPHAIIEALSLPPIVAPIEEGYLRIVGWAWMIEGWCYLGNGRYESAIFGLAATVENILIPITALALYASGILAIGIPAILCARCLFYLVLRSLIARRAPPPMPMNDVTTLGSPS